MKSLRAKLASLRSTEKADKKYEKSDPAPESVPVTDGMEKASADLVMDQPGAMTSDAPAETPPRLVVAHFMLGSTYNFNEEDWLQTFREIAATDLDGLALNLGPEDWQFTQARSAFHVLARSPYSYACCSPTSSTKSVRRPLRLFISMDMNVLPATTSEEAESLKNKVLALLRMEDGILQERDIVQQEAEGVAESREGDWNRDMGKLYLQWEGRKVLSTFSGHAAPMGGQGWEGWLSTLERELGEEVCFFPSFFVPPAELASIPYARGLFPWNAAWPMDHPTPETLSLRNTDPLLFPPYTVDPSPSQPSAPRDAPMARKAYMTSISPCFYTHYAAPGTTPSGTWEWGKNWVYASDELMMVRRWERLLALDWDQDRDRQRHRGEHCSLAAQEISGRVRTPDIIQVISWNDYGESHYICPSILGCQPGSESWVDGMPHGALGEVVKWMTGRWRDGKGEVDILYEGLEESKSESKSESAGARGAEGQMGAHEEAKAKVWIWYRTHPADIEATSDERGKPEHTDRAVDLINVVVLLPRANITDHPEAAAENQQRYSLVIVNGPGGEEHRPEHEHTLELEQGKANMFMVPFIPGQVHVSLCARDAGGEGKGDIATIWREMGAEINAEVRTYNYNFSSYGWDVDL